MAAPVNIIVGSLVWVEDPALAWMDGEVFRISGDEVHITTTVGRTVVASISKVYPKDTESPPGGVDDMTKLSYLHEPGVLHNLAMRYELNEIYGPGFGERSPHVFAVADVAAMINEGKSNSILVSGESGAGKTETTKMLMRYLAYLGGRSGVEGRTVEQQVSESNPVLEAFGNAKTIRNNNSSRFGKFVEIQFDKSGRISGTADREKYKLDNPKSFHYLNQSNCSELDGVNDAHEYLVTRRAMDVVGISEKEQEALF